MTDAVYLRAKPIALAALEQPTATRAHWLDTHCGHDAELRREVDWLIAAADTATDSDATEALLPGWEPGLPGHADTLGTGSQVDAAHPGQYRILRQLGEGGMGVVYLAERSDGGTAQQVALKLLSGSATQNARLAARMTDERRILAALHHPNIAHLVDGGTTANGQPYIAMEYVQGERIDLWCQQGQLPLRERLQLMLKVCAAVEHAHQRLVIHRDLKPANILVDADGEPKLLDFGIARLTEPHVQADPTQTAHRALTLAYASPEHVAGKPLSTATDIWSLGIVLYELLTGTRPHQALESGHLLSGAIISGDIRPPSTATRALRADRDLRTGEITRTVGRIPADIDAIVLKALRHAPEQRYASASALADDLRRFLQSRPVSARRGHALYRLRMFTSRHRWPVAAASVVLVAATAFLFDREQQLQRITDERNKAQALTGFMTELFNNANPSQSQGERVTVREMLDLGAERIEADQTLAQDIRADLLMTMASAYGGLGLPQQAIPLAERSLQLQRAHAIPPTELADTLASLAGYHSQMGENTTSIDLNRQAQAFLSPDDPDQFEQWATLRLTELANLELMGAMPSAGIIDALGELEGRIRQAGDNESLAELHIHLLENKSKTLRRDGQLDASLAAQSAAVELARRHQADRPMNLLVSRRNLATVMADKDPKAAVDMLEDIDREHLLLVGERSAERAVLLNQLAVSYHRSGRVEESLRTSEKAVDLARDTLGPRSRFFLQLAVTHAMGLEDAGRIDEARTLLSEVIPHLEARSAPGIDAAAYAYALNAYGKLLLNDGGDVNEALALLTRSEDVIAPHADDFLIVYNGTIRELVRALGRLGRHEEATLALNRYRNLLDRRNEPQDSQWRRQLASISEGSMQ